MSTTPKDIVGFLNRYTADQKSSVCHTALDGYESVQWPDRFVELPRVGDYVEGRRGNQRPRLRVVAVTHRADERGEPRVEIELHR